MQTNIKIQVKNNNKPVFAGNSQQWLTDNEHDQEVLELIQECIKNGYSCRNFISGFWEVNLAK